MSLTEGDDRLGQSEEAFQKERELMKGDPVRKDELNAILRRKGADNPQAPQNIEQLMQGLAELYQKLSSDQRSGLAKILPHLGKANPTPEELESLTEELLQAHEINEMLKSRQGQQEQPINYPRAEMTPPRNAAPINSDELLQRRLLEGLRGGVGRAPEHDSNTEELIEFSQPPYPPIEIPVKIDKGDLMNWMRQILNSAERSERESYGAEINAGELQRIAMVMRALREKSRKINGENPEEARKYMDKAESMREEYEARLYFHEYFVQFRRPEDADRMFDNGQMLRSRYFKIILDKPEVRKALIMYVRSAEGFLKARGENRTKPENIGRVPKTKEDFRFEFRIKIAREFLPDEWAGKLFNGQRYENLNEEQKVQVQGKVTEEINRFERDEHGSEELFVRFGWAQNLAERMWRIGGVAAVQDRLTGRVIENGQIKKNGEFLDGANNGDLLMQRSINVINNFWSSKDAFSFWPQLLNKVDLGNKDFFTYILGEIVKNERKKLEITVKQDHPDLAGDDLKEAVEQELKEYIQNKFGYTLARKKDDRNEEIRGEEYRPLNASDVAFNGNEGQQIYKLIDQMSDKTLEEIFNYDWDSFSDTTFRGWQWFNLINIDKLRGSQISAGRDKEAFLINPSAETLSKFVALLAYRSGDQPKIRTQLAENLWTYMAHERKQHTGVHNAGWDELESMLANAIESNVVTHGMAREAMKKAVKNDLLILYKDVEKYFSWWEFLLGLIFDTFKEGLKPVPA